MRINVSEFLFGLLIVFYLLTRLYQINYNPPSVYWDEASIGYNAYSILKTGRDEWGEFMPLNFRAFGEYKLPVFIYSEIPFIALLGLHEWSIRIPAVLYGLGSAIAIFLILQKITLDKKIALFGMFLFIIQPWTFLFTRAGYEASAGLCFYLFCLYFLLQSKHIKYFLYAIICALLSMYSYNSFRLITPLTVIFFIITQKILFNNQKKILLIATLLFMIGVVPIIFAINTGEGTARLQTVGIFQPDVSKYTLSAQLLRNYLSHFSADFLFQTGDKIARNHVTGLGELYFLDGIFILLGLYSTITSRKNTFILLLLLIAPLPAAITKESPHALRAIATAPLLVILCSLGVKEGSRLIASKKLLPMLATVYLLFFGYFYYQFLFIYPMVSSSEWQYGYSQIYRKYASEFSRYDHIVITDRQNQPYIFALSYLQYDPSKFLIQKVVNTSKTAVTSQIASFDKFIFTDIDFYSFPSGKNLIFADPSERLTEIPERDIITNKDGSPALYVYAYEK
jgi:hypothetical protein